MKLGFKRKPYGAISTAIGELYVFYLSTSDYSNLIDSFNQDLKDVDSDLFARGFVKYSCFPKDRLVDNEYKPKSPILDDEVIKKISIEDMEKISRLYISKNEHLFKKQITKKSINKEGKEVISFEYGEIIHPKKDDESWIKYLHRLITLECVNIKEIILNISKSSLMNVSKFSENIADNILKTFTLGDSLTKKIEGFQSISDKTLEKLNNINIAPIDSSPQSADFSLHNNLERMRELEIKNRLKPFRELGHKLDELINISNQANEFIIDANKTQTLVASGINKSGYQSSKFSKINLFLSCIVILLTIFNIFIGIYVWKSDNNQFDSGVKEVSEAFSSFNENIKDISNQIKTTTMLFQKNSTDQYDLLLQYQNTERKELFGILKKQDKQIQNLISENSEQARKNKILEERIKNVEKGQPKK